jgi:hypothetical protein
MLFLNGMQIYNAKTSYIEVRFMTGNIKGINFARALKKITILPLTGIGNNLCNGADIPNSKADIEQYFRHDVKFNNLNGKLRIRNSQGLGQLKSGRSKFCMYLEQHRVYIKKAQLGE